MASTPVPVPVAARNVEELVAAGAERAPEVVERERDDSDSQGEELVVAAAKRGLTDQRRAAVRERALAEIPWWYSPQGHLAATTGIGLSVLVASVVALVRLEHPVRWTDFLVVPTVIVVANYYEWRVHRDVLHKRLWPFEVIYEKHTPMHHMIYVEDDMAVRDVRELRLVLIPAAGVLGIVIGATPAAVVLAYLWSSAAGWLFLLTASLFMVSYEVLHLCYHAPKTSFIGQRRLIARLRAHHARHHDPRLMQRYNFNVTLPLFDWVMGTVAPRRTDT